MPKIADEIREQALARLDAGESQKDVAYAMGICTDSLRAWLRKRDQPEPAYRMDSSDAEIADALTSRCVARVGDVVIEGDGEAVGTALMFLLPTVE